MTDSRSDMKALTLIRKNLHFGAVFLGTVWDETHDLRADKALEEIADMRFEYDAKWEAMASQL